MKQRIEKILSSTGFCSRRAAKGLLKDGKVMLNSRVALPGEGADPESDSIIIGNKAVVSDKKKIYVVLNKPKGFVSTLSSEEGRRAVDLVDIGERIYPVGRLDKDASGLLILTNDGDFANRVMHPKSIIIKKYFVRLESPLSKDDEKAIRQGVRLKDCFVKPRLEMAGRKNAYITISQGQNKIVKRIFKAFGYYVRDLTRVQIGSLRLDVKPGRWRFLRPYEVSALMQSGRPCR